MKFLKHEPCPKCNSVDNLGVWEDGHKFCFGCRYYVPATGNQVRFKLQQQESETNNVTNITLPFDFTYTIPAIALTWLKKYDLTEREIIQNKIGWSSYYDRLIFPSFDNRGNLVLCQGRYFGLQRDRLKYITQGLRESCYHILGSQSSASICLVEDVISCIKVSRVSCCMPLWGSNIGLERIRKLSERFKSLTLWLDKDKAIESVRTRLKASGYFKEVRCIITEKDPKEYSTNEIKDLLCGRM